MASVFARWNKQPPIEQLLPKLEQWFDSEWGSRLLSCQRSAIDNALSRCFGYHLLQLSVDSRIELFNGCRVQKKYRCHPFAKNVNATCNFEQLPFANESLDVVILHHVHEFIDDPHQLLREIQRVIVPHGHLIILGFNPWSLLGVATVLRRFSSSSIGHNQLIRCNRMKDWLSLLGFETHQVNFGCHTPGMIERSNNILINDFLTTWPFGNYYLISAIKQIATITPVKPTWKQARKNFVGLIPVKPGVGNYKPGHLSTPILKKINKRTSFEKY